MSITFSELRLKCKILTHLREDMTGIRDLFDEKTRVIESLKNDIKKKGIASKYRELELLEANKSLELIRIQFETKNKERTELKELITAIHPNEALDLRYKEIKQMESELCETIIKNDIFREECEEMEMELEQVCKEYEELKHQIKVSLSDKFRNYDYNNPLYKNNTNCLKQIGLLEKNITDRRNLYETKHSEDLIKRDEINRCLAEFFKICTELEEEPELEEGVLL